MWRKRILAAGAVVLIIVAIGVARLQAIDGLLSRSIKKEGKSYVSVPIVHHIGFWSHEDDFSVTELQVQQRETMRASQPHAKIHIAIEGSLRNGRRLKELYVREQFRDATNGKRIVEVVIVPVCEPETIQANEPERSPLVTTAEYTLHQYQWPDNTYLIICGGHTRELNYRYP